MENNYMYRIQSGKAILNSGDNKPLKTIGHFKTDAQAREACEKHYQKACKALANMGQSLPNKFYF